MSASVTQIRPRLMATAISQLTHPVVGKHIPPPKAADKNKHAVAPYVAWDDLKAAAAWQPHDVTHHNQTANLQRGEFLAARGYWAQEWNWSDKAVRSFFDKLVKEEMIEFTAKVGGRVAVARITNYDKYQLASVYSSPNLAPGQVKGQVKGQVQPPSTGQVKGQVEINASAGNIVEFTPALHPQGPSQGPSASSARGQVKGRVKGHTVLEEVEVVVGDAHARDAGAGTDIGDGVRLEGDRIHGPGFSISIPQVEMEGALHGMTRERARLAAQVIALQWAAGGFKPDLPAKAVSAALRQRTLNEQIDEFKLSRAQKEPQPQSFSARGQRFFAVHGAGGYKVLIETSDVDRVIDEVAGRTQDEIVAAKGRVKSKFSSKKGFSDIAVLDALRSELGGSNASAKASIMDLYAAVQPLPEMSMGVS